MKTITTACRDTHCSVPHRILTKRVFARIVCAVLLVSIFAPVATAQRDPDRLPIEDLLPETTVAFVQIPDIRDAIEKSMDGGFGKFIDDEAVAPLRDRIIEETYKAYSDVEERVGMSLDELTSIPSGEMVFAAIAPRRSSPVYMVVLEVGEENEAANKAFDLAMENVEDDEENEIEKAELESGLEVDKVIVDGEPIFIARREGLIVGCSSEQVLDEFFVRWGGGEVKKVRPLSKNRKFVTIMNRCQSTKDLPIDFRFFFDPVALTKSSGRGNLGMQTAIAVFPALGVDSILALGGTAILSDDEYETIMHGHLLLSNPRKGVTKVFSLKPDEYQPEDWVPSDAFFYTTTSWDVTQMFQEIRSMVDLVVGEGTFDNFTTSADEFFGRSLEEEILPNLDGRVSVTQVSVDPGKINSGSTIVGMGLEDVEKATETFEELVEHFNTENEKLGIEKREFQDCSYWVRSESAIGARDERRKKQRAERRKGEKDEKELERFERRDKRREMMQGTFRAPRPCVGIVNNSLIFSDSIEAFEKVVLTHKGESSPLRNEEGFLGMASKMTRLLDTDLPVAMYYSNPKQQLEPMMAYLNSDANQEVLNVAAEENEFVKTFKNILDDHELPSMEVLEKYMAVQGAFVTSDDTGYHMLWFQERLEIEE